MTVPVFALRRFAARFRAPSVMVPSGEHDRFYAVSPFLSRPTGKPPATRPRTHSRTSAHSPLCRTSSSTRARRSCCRRSCTREGRCSSGGSRALRRRRARRPLPGTSFHSRRPQGTTNRWKRRTRRAREREGPKHPSLASDGLLLCFRLARRGANGPRAGDAQQAAVVSQAHPSSRLSFPASIRFAAIGAVAACASANAGARPTPPPRSSPRGPPPPRPRLPISAGRSAAMEGR